MMMVLYLACLQEPEDRDIFLEFYKEYRGLMFQAAIDVLGKRQLAEDAVQDAFIAILEQVKQLRQMGEGQRTGFAVVVARNKAVDILRRERGERTDSLEELEEDALLIDFQPDEEDGVFGRIPGRYADVLKLVGLGLRPGEIAQLTGREVQTVYKQIARGKKLLGEVLEKEGYPWPGK